MKDINILYQAAMQDLMDKVAIKYKQFYSTKEFKENRTKILNIGGAKRRLIEQLNKEE